MIVFRRAIFERRLTDHGTSEACAARWKPFLAGDWRLDEVEGVSGEVGDLLAEAGSGTDVLIYVHGFNQTFETATLDAARLSDATKFRGRTGVFSWPSKAGLFDYAYDRESAASTMRPSRVRSSSSGGTPTRRAMYCHFGA